MSQPPEYPGRRRLKRAAAAAGSEAYQGAFEAIGSVLIAGGIGYWVDWRWETTPVGLLIGVVLGFAAMVLRLVRLGRELDPAATGSDAEATRPTEGWPEDDRGIGETPGMSPVLLDERDEGKHRAANRDRERSETEGKKKKEKQMGEKARREGIGSGRGRRDENERT